jgi:hypothetical protein
LKNTIARIIAKTGYHLTRDRSANITLFNSLSEYHLQRQCNIADDFLLHCLFHIEQSNAQRFQDLMVDFFMKGQSGVFCEFGATNGIDLSNSYFLETNRGWDTVA